jgi:hypothetical protein
VSVPVPVSVPGSPVPPERPLSPVGWVGAGGGAELVVVVVLVVLEVVDGVELWVVDGEEPELVELCSALLEPLELLVPVRPVVVLPECELGVPPTGFAKCPPLPLLEPWLVVELVGVGVCVDAIGVTEVGGVDWLEPEELVDEPLGVEELGVGAAGAGWVPVPNAPAPRYGALPLVVGVCGAVGWDGVTPVTGALGSSGLTICFVPVRPFGDSGWSTATSVVVEVRFSWRVPALTTTGGELVATDAGADVAALGRLAATAAAVADAACTGRVEGRRADVMARPEWRCPPALSWKSCTATIVPAVPTPAIAAPIRLLITPPLKTEAAIVPPPIAVAVALPPTVAPSTASFSAIVGTTGSSSRS